MTGTHPILELADVTKTYPSPDGAGAVILDGVSLRVARGESVSIVGPSGSGKSTLLNIMGTLDRPTAGQVMLDGVDLLGLDEKRLAVVRNREIGFVFQLHHLLPQCTVLENALIPSLVNGRAAQAREEARRLLDRVGLSHRLSYRPGQLSGGERQRVAVVRALINKPKLILADEPTGSLDHAGAEDLGRLLAGLNKQEGVTLVVVTHSAELARSMGRTLQLRDGKLTQA